MTAPRHLYTLGYEGQTIDRFVARLIDVGIGTVVDVRELPLSRKRGFSKRALAATLETHGIRYVHLPALGCPKAVRDRLKTDGDWRRYVRDFETHLAEQATVTTKVVEMARVETCGLLCFEADYNRCHRSLVARNVAVRGGPSVVHVTPTATIPDAAQQAAA